MIFLYYIEISSQLIKTKIGSYMHVTSKTDVETEEGGYLLLDYVDYAFILKNLMDI